MRAVCDCRIVRSRGVVVRHGTLGSHHAKEYATGPLTAVSKHLL